MLFPMIPLGYVGVFVGAYLLHHKILLPGADHELAA